MFEIDHIEGSASAEQGADQAAQGTCRRGPQPGNPCAAFIHEQCVHRVQQHEYAQTMRQHDRIDRLEQIQACEHADCRERQQGEDLPPLDLRAVFETVTGRGDVVEQHHQRDHYRQRQEQGQQGDSDQPGTKTGDAAHDIGDDQCYGTKQPV